MFTRNILSGAIILLFALQPLQGQVENKSAGQELTIIGEWIRQDRRGVSSLHFKPTGQVAIDMNNDGQADVSANYTIENEIIIFHDQEGHMCQHEATYKLHKNKYYIGFDLIEDDCPGRIKTMMGFWVRPDHQAHLEELTTKIEEQPENDHYFSRARMHMALGESTEARKDLDSFIAKDTTNAGAYINRAATKFPDDIEEAIEDLDVAMRIEPNNKNVYFLRGLALYNLGKEERACENFWKAIELGFTVLKSIESDKCRNYWDEFSNEQ